MIVTTLAILAWGAFAFGGVYPWAYTPMLIVCLSVGVAGVRPRPGGVESPHSGTATVALVATTVGVLCQLVPLPRQVLRVISPATDQFLVSQNLGYAYAVSVQVGAEHVSEPWHPISIDPIRTAVAAVFLVTLALFAAGLSRRLGTGRAIRLAKGMTAIGGLLAITGIIQKATFNGRIYGVWTPQFVSTPFGPFVNSNHFAGCMLMVLPLSIGVLYGHILQVAPSKRFGWRNRLLWIGTADACQLALIALAILLMTFALLLTMSRSGISCLILIVVLACVAFRQTAASRPAARRVATVVVLLLVIAGLSWVDSAAVISKFERPDTLSFSGRLAIWRDALHIARDFAVTGTGLNTYGTATFLYQTSERDVYHVEQPHSDYLQLLAEGGLLVSMPAAALLVFVACDIWRGGRAAARVRDCPYRSIRVGAILGLVVVACQELAEFSLQMPGNAVVFVVLTAIALAGPRADLRSDALA